MTKKLTDITDEEIRVISSDAKPGKRNRKRAVVIIICAAVLILAAIACLFLFYDDGSESEPLETEIDTETPAVTVTVVSDTVSIEKGFTTVTDTLVNGTKLTILTPVNATATLTIGNKDILTDSSVVLLVQAADIRKDNHKIAGAFVVNGELMSRGEAKAGFCSIINDEITVGVSDATPKLEEALTAKGYFFRQYPLVVGAQVVENKPKGKSIRKALTELNGRICVITSPSRLTFHEFSQALVDAGVRNAIYLVGGNSLMKLKKENGEEITTGAMWTGDTENINYMVWR